MSYRLRIIPAILVPEIFPKDTGYEQAKWWCCPVSIMLGL